MWCSTINAIVNAFTTFDNVLIALFKMWLPVSGNVWHLLPSWSCLKFLTSLWCCSCMLPACSWIQCCPLLPISYCRSSQTKCDCVTNQFDWALVSRVKWLPMEMAVWSEMDGNRYSHYLNPWLCNNQYHFQIFEKYRLCSCIHCYQHESFNQKTS